MTIDNSVIYHIRLERKFVREYPSVGGYVKNSIAHRIYNATAHAQVLSDTFSLQWDISVSFRSIFYKKFKVNDDVRFIGNISQYGHSYLRSFV